MVGTPQPLRAEASSVNPGSGTILNEPADIATKEAELLVQEALELVGFLVGPNVPGVDWKP